MNSLRRSYWAMFGLFVALFGIVGILVFRDVLAPDRILFTTDNNIGVNAGYARSISVERGCVAWAGGPLLGATGRYPLALINVLRSAVPLEVYQNWFHAFALCIGSALVALLLLARGCRVLAAVVGSLTVFWVGSNLTLTYAGHDGKYGVLLFSALALFLIEMAATRMRLAWSVVAGAAVGMMFVEQQDVALFIGLFVGAYAVYAILRENAWRWRPLVLPLILMAGVAALVGGPNVLSGYLTQVKGVVSMSEENPQQKWEFCTQWSLPPEDTLEFIAPAYRGIRSGEPEGPYWGRLGRSAEWERTGQGFQNFRLDGVYVGAIPIGLACLALFLAMRGNRGGTQKTECARIEWLQWRSDIIFWGIVTVVALLLSYGKFFPLYALFYKIPGMSSIRNPNKFLHVFQIGLGILTAFGADVLLRGVPDVLAKWTRRFGVTLLCVAGILVIWSLGLSLSRDDLVRGFVDSGWSRYAPVMAGHMIRAAFHATVMTLIIGVAMLLLVSWRCARAWKRHLVMAALAVAMLGDIVLLSRDYIKTVNLSEVAGDNAVTTFLKVNLNQQRAYMLSQEGFYNSWLTLLFPYHAIEMFNAPAMPRMPEDYGRWLKTVGKDPLRLWQLSAIGYVLAPDPIWQQIRKDPRFASHFEAVKGFDVFASGMGMGVTEVPGDRPAQHRILRFKDGLPRFKLFHDWAVVPDELVNEQLSNRSFDPHAQVLVAPDTAQDLPKALPASNAIPETVSAVLSSADARVTVVTASPAVLMFVNKHEPDWRVKVDGKPSPLLRCNSLCLGVFLEPGRHEVVFDLRPQGMPFWVQAAGLLAGFAGILWLCIRRRKEDKS